MARRSKKRVSKRLKNTKKYRGRGGDPNGTEEVPVVSEEVPVVSEEVPVVSEEVPVVSEEAPLGSEEVPVRKLLAT